MIYSLSSHPRRSGLDLRASRRRTVLVLIALAAAFSLAGSAFSQPSSAALPFGEVGRFGGFDPTGGKTTGPLAKFVLPVGFAVDPKNAPDAEEAKLESERGDAGDENAVYVLDRTVSNFATEGHGELGYRLQKLSSTGVVLGSVTLPLQKYADTRHFTDAHPLISLAVDPEKHRVYALLESIVEEEEENIAPVAHALVAWSTVPNASKELVPAAGYPGPVDPVTGAALVGGETALQPSNIEKDLLAPEALSIDSGNHDVVIEAQQGGFSGSGSVLGGPTILQRVATEGTKSGQRDESWEDSDMTKPPQGDGLLTTNDGSFVIDQLQGHENVSQVVSLLTEIVPRSPFVTSATSPVSPDTSEGQNVDEAITLEPEITINLRSSWGGGGSGSGNLEANTAGSPIAQLSGGLYAALYGNTLTTNGDPQAKGAPWDVTHSFWEQASTAEPPEPANEGIRLFTKEANGNAQIVTTLGGQPLGHECNIDTGRVALAAGAKNTLFALTQPNAEDGDDQVIEFAEGGKGACPQPSGTIEAEGKEAQLKAGETVPVVTVEAGKPVKFDAITINRAGETPFSFEWRFEGAGSSGAALQVHRIEAGTNKKYEWPTPEADFEYKTPGTYEASVTLRGDYGTTVFPVKVKARGAQEPVASFECTPSSGAIAGQTSVVCDGSASRPTPGAEIESCHWTFGGTGEETTPGLPHEGGCPPVSYVFPEEGAPTVTLTLTDEAGHTAKAEHKVTVSKAESTPPPGGNQPVSNPIVTPITVAPIVTPPVVVVPKPTTPGKPPLTDSQKLADALKVCKRKPKKARAGCEKQAEKKYAPKKKKSKKKR